MLTMREIHDADTYIEDHAQVLDSISMGLGLGDVLRDLWRDIRAHYFCDCTGDDHEPLCPLTPIYAELVADSIPTRILLGAKRTPPWVIFHDHDYSGLTTDEEQT